MLIPKLFEAIRLGNVKSEYVLGDRIIGRRQVRLKLVAEVVDPGSNPLATHSQMRSVKTAVNDSREASQPSASQNAAESATNLTAEPPTGPRRGPRRRHPLSKR